MYFHSGVNNIKSIWKDLKVNICSCYIMSNHIKQNSNWCKKHEKMQIWFFQHYRWKRSYILKLRWQTTWSFLLVSLMPHQTNACTVIEKIGSRHSINITIKKLSNTFFLNLKRYHKSICTCIQKFAFVIVVL